MCYLLKWINFSVKKNKTLKEYWKMAKNTGKVREKSGNFVSTEKWEPCPGCMELLLTSKLPVQTSRCYYNGNMIVMSSSDASKVSSRDSTAACFFIQIINFFFTFFLFNIMSRKKALKKWGFFFIFKNIFLAC